MTRIKTIAVAEALRSNGIGGALLLRCWQIYERSGYMIVFGQSDDTPALQRFFARRGFVVLDRDTGFDPWVVLGVHAEVRPDIGQRTFIWHRGRNRRLTAPRPRPRAARDDRSRPGTPTNYRPEQSLRQPREWPLPLLNVGAVPLVMGVAEDPSKAPLSLLVAAAVQAGWRASAESRARLHHQVAAALRQLGFAAKVVAAQVTVWREAEPADAAVTVEQSSHTVTRTLVEGHTVLWAESWRVLLDIAVVLDARVRDLAGKELRELLATPAMLPVASIEPFVSAAPMLAVERGPIRIGWELFDADDTAGSHDTESDAAEQGGKILADATIDLLLATAGYIDLAPMHARFPHLQAVMTRRASSLWTSAGGR